MLASIINALPLATPGRKTLLTPGFVNPGILKRHLAFKAGNLANVIVQPVGEFLLQQSAPLFPKGTYIAGDRLFMLMRSLLRGIKPQLRYFHESVDFEGFCALMLETMNELRLNGITDSHLRELPDVGKWTDVLLVLHEYERRKHAANLFDYADAVDTLLAHPVQCRSTFAIRHRATIGEEQLISALGITWVETEPDTPSTNVLSGYAVDTPYQEALQTIRNVMDDLLGKDSLGGSSTRPLRIGICTSHYNATYYHIRPVLQQLGLPDLVHWAKGEPLFATPAGSLWKHLAEWIQNNCSIYRLVRVLESSSFDRDEVAAWSPDLEGREISASLFHYAVRYFRDSGLVLFNEGFPRAFERFLEGKAIRDPESERGQFVSTAVDIARTLAQRFALFLAPGPLNARIGVLQDVFLSMVRIQSGSDANAVAKIEALIDGVRESLSAAETELSFGEAVALITEKLDGMYVNVRLPDFTRPVLGTLEDLRYGEFDILYMTDLNEKGISRKIFQNPILLDEEKTRLMRLTASNFLLREDKLKEAEEMFEQVTTGVRERLVVSASLKDLATGRDLLVSRALLDLWNTRTGTRQDYHTMARLLRADPRSQNNHVVARPEDAFYNYERGVAVHVAHQGKRLLHADLEGDFPFVHSVRAWLHNRKTAGEFNEYWGIVNANPARPLPVFSASRISRWTRCPYQYFLTYELGLDVYEDFEADSLEWLDAMSYGSFMHDVFYKFFVRLRETKGVWFTSIEAKDVNLLREVFEEVREEYVLSHPVTSPVHYESQRARLLRDAELFLQKEIQNSDSRLYVELAFHMPVKEGREPLITRSTPAVIALADGSLLNVRGSIDRVDASGKRHILYDYKTGRARNPLPSRPFDGGSLIQAGLYSEVVGQIDPAIKDPLFRFYFTSEEQGFTQYEVDYPRHRGHFLALLTEIVVQLRKGNFVPVADLKYNGGVCSWCDFLSVCLKGKKELADELKANDVHHATLKSIQKEDIPQGFR
jgi:hypothetical protein